MLPIRRILAEWALLAASLALLAGLAAGQAWLWRADQAIYDASLALGGHRPADDILLIAIDDESLARIGRWPWRRAVHATLVERLTAAGARAVALDLIFSEADDLDAAGDQALAAAIRRNGRVVLPVAQQNFGPGLLAEGLPIEPLAQAAAALGHIETELDADGINRGLFLWAGVDAPRHPQLALALLQLAAPELASRYRLPAPTAAGEPGWQRDGWLQLPFAGPPGTYRTVSYVDVLSGQVAGELLKDKLVLVGATAAGLGDNYPTPMSGFGRAMAGVEIHATALDALRSGEAIRVLPAAVNAALAVIATLALMLAHLRLSPRGGLLLSAIVTVAGLGSSFLLLHWGRLWLPPSALLAAAALAYPLWSWRRLETAQRYLDDELALLGGGPAGSHPGALEERIAIVRAAAQQQRQAQQTREETLRFISHDIRAPLASIVTVAEDADDATASQRLGQVCRYAQGALDLADDLVRLARAEAIDPGQFIAIDLADVAQEAADEVWAKAHGKGIALVVDCAGAAEMLGDAALLRRALVNLLDNAIKYSPAATTVRLALTTDDGGYCLCIADQGEGITADRLPTLFERYQRVSGRGQGRGGGIGLGLAIVKAVVDRHGGQIAVDSRPGQGSRFCLRLPAAARLAQK